MCDELLKGRKSSVFGSDSSGLGTPGRRREVVTRFRRGRRHKSRVASDDVVGGLGEVGDHVTAHRLVDKLFQCSLVELLHGEVS